MAKRLRLNLTDEQEQELIEHRDHHSRPDVREKAAALLKIAQGASPHSVARCGLLKPRDPDTVYAWLKCYLSDGCSGLIDHRHGGARHRLSDKKKQEISERLHQAPGNAARKEMMLTDSTPPPSRWTLRTIRASIDWLADYTLSGVHRLLKRCDLCIRSGRVQQYSPDPDYEEKVTRLLDCLRQTALEPMTHVLVFLDEMSYTYWPEPARVWTAAAPEDIPVASCGGKNNRQWRIIGALNAITGQVSYLDNYIVGRAKVIEMYQLLHETYTHAQKIFVVQDNWSIHKHPEVNEALSALTHIEPVWLPTYAPWLNPIEKLWRWLRQSVLKMHPYSSEWVELRIRVNQFLSQFASGSTELLQYVGLAGDSKLALACKPK